jgi:hypothetical protein
MPLSFKWMMGRLLQWLAEGTIPVEDMISHRIPLSLLKKHLSWWKTVKALKFYSIRHKGAVMPTNETALREFGQNIQKLIDKEDLSRDISYGMLRQLLEDSQTDLH